MTSKKEIINTAELFLAENYSNLLGVDEPVFDKSSGVWRAQIIYVSKPAKFNLDLEMVFDSRGRLLTVPSLEKVHQMIDKKYDELGIIPETYPEAISKTK